MAGDSLLTENGQSAGPGPSEPDLNRQRQANQLRSTTRNRGVRPECRRESLIGVRLPFGAARESTDRSVHQGSQADLTGRDNALGRAVDQRYVLVLGR